MMHTKPFDGKEEKKKQTLSVEPQLIFYIKANFIVYSENCALLISVQNLEHQLISHI